MTGELPDALEDDTRDSLADEEIRRALNPASPQSFFLFAGAGSGKTRSLKDALEFVVGAYGEALRRRGRQIAVITYTNAACDEIRRRVNHDPIFYVETIHSFAWSLIDGRNEDIRGWLSAKLPDEITKLQEEQVRGRPGKTSDDRARKIGSKEKRLAELPNIKSFTYNPNGDNFGRDSLSHEEVISMTSEFLVSKEMLQKIVLSRFPFILVDESQDTLKPFMTALLEFEKTYKGRISLGLFGDTMQRIYPHGLRELANCVPPHWRQPAKIMNHRSRQRIVDLANAIRADDDGRKQQARKDRAGGLARVYLFPSSEPDRAAAESRAREDMAVATGDAEWLELSEVKTLTLEHHMAAHRLGFPNVFDPIDKVNSFRTSFRDGTMAPLRLFTERVLPLVEANQARDSFALMALLRAHSPLVAKKILEREAADVKSRLDPVRAAVKELMKLFEDSSDPVCGEVLNSVAGSKLFDVPVALQPLIGADLNDHTDTTDEQQFALKTFLKAKFSEIAKYREYVEDRSPYGTHQGVKGLEFQRVMVVADDASARFKGTAAYEKLLGAKPKSKTDEKNEAEGKETAFERTRRLLYVTCTRAEESLAIVVYSDNPAAIEQLLVSKGWFSLGEIFSLK